MADGKTSNNLVVDGLPPCTIHMTDDGTWHVVMRIAAGEQAALATEALSPEALCQRAQHALGLAGIGSCIEHGCDAIGVYAAPLRSPSGEATLVLEGREVLWWVSQATPEAILALIAAATSAMRNTPNS